MNSSRFRSFFLILCAAAACTTLLAACGGGAETGAAAPPSRDWLAPRALLPAPDGATLFVGTEQSHEVLVVDPATGEVLRRTHVGGPATGLALTPSGDRLLVTVGLPEGLLAVLDPATLEVEKTIPVGHSPLSPVVAPDGATVWVCNRFDNAVGCVDLAAGVETAVIDTPREPTAAALTPDGGTLMVANHLPNMPANGDFTAAEISLVDTASKEVRKTILLPNGSSGLRDAAISPDGKYGFVTHILGRYQIPTTQLERGWMNTNALSVIDMEQGERLNTVLLDDVDLGAANPWAVAISSDGARLIATHAGTHEASVINLPAMLEKMLALPAEAESEAGYDGIAAADLPNRLSWLVDVRERRALEGQGARSAAILGDRLYAGMYFTDNLAVVDLTGAPLTSPTLALGPAPTLTLAQAGEKDFNDGELCFQKWQSCASCHPDGRADGLNWDLLNDGMGNPKNARSLLASPLTPPVMSTGVRDRAETAVRAGIKYIQFAEAEEHRVEAIRTYLEEMEPVVSPYRENGEMTAEAKRGEELFFSEEIGCGRCHPRPLFTSMELVDVGTKTGPDTHSIYDTPTLIEVWRTAPYLHSGAYVTVRDVIEKSNHSGMRSAIAELSGEDVDALVRFVLSQ